MILPDPRPIVALDIDGTLSPWPVPSGPLWRTIPASDVPTSPFFGGVRGVPAFLPTSLRHTVKDWLLRLHASGTVELAWATLWENAAEHYAAAHDLPLGLRVLTDSAVHPPKFGHVTHGDAGAWKAHALSHIPAERPLIWLDDIAGRWIAPPAPAASDPWYDGLDPATTVRELAADTRSWKDDLRHHGIRRGHSHNELVIAPNERVGLTDDHLDAVDAFLARHAEGAS